MTYMPDTNVWIKLLNTQPTSVKERFLSTDSREIALCSIVLAELYFGAYKSARHQENLETVNKIKRAYRIFPFDETAAIIYGRVRATLARTGALIGPRIEVIMLYHAVTEKNGDWWIGWLVDLEGVNAQERSMEALLESLRLSACDMLEVRGLDSTNVELVLDTESGQSHYAMSGEI